ncbi:MAG TPA: L,D-transpeptidase [Chthoniobacterales bacterium]|nr:L,D-transpeptidase [Chthoniobacterales bacterium]
MRLLSRLLLSGCALAVAGFLTSCGTAPMTAGGNYHVVAHRPHDASKVRVKVSLAQENVYVMEGDRCLMAAATTVGIPAKPTPKGNFTIYSKQEHKRSGSYGFRVQGNRVIPAEAGSNISGRYVGYPMGYWCEFSPAYGFHQGYVHPHPRSHGCLRLKGEAAAKFFALVHSGTPVNIAETQPEDATLGKTVQRIDDSRTPDPDPRISVSDAAFQAPSGPLLEE